jgi:hypothetical protein
MQSYIAGLERKTRKRSNADCTKRERTFDPPGQAYAASYWLFA